MTITEQQVIWYNDTKGTLNEQDGIECKTCKNRGFIYKAVNDNIYTIPCRCMKRRIAIKIAKASNAEQLLKVHTFENYTTGEEWQKIIAGKARKFCECNGGALYIGGGIGSGKTHICIAILNELIEQEKECRYYVWSDMATMLNKLMVDDEREYDRLLKELANLQVLYIDDFFREQPSKAEIKLAFHIINTRYMNVLGGAKLYTIISSQNNINELLEIDEAIASRIYEMATQENVISIRKDGSKNWRMKKATEV